MRLKEHIWFLFLFLVFVFVQLSLKGEPSQLYRCYNTGFNLKGTTEEPAVILMSHKRKTASNANKTTIRIRKHVYHLLEIQKGADGAVDKHKIVLPAKKNKILKSKFWKH